MENVRPEVKWFAEQMEKRLAENDWQPGWKHADVFHLYEKLKHNTVHLYLALRRFTEEMRIDCFGEDFYAERERVIKQATDVANFAMMLADIARETIYDKRVTGDF